MHEHNIKVYFQPLLKFNELFSNQLPVVLIFLSFEKKSWDSNELL